MKIAIIFIIFMFLLMLSSCKQEKGELIMKENVALENIKIIGVYDNVEFNPEFKIGFGFGCVVKLKDKNILFDTGSDSPTLLTNLETAGIKPEEISIIVLSHIHEDHVGGLLGFLEKNSNVKVYLPDSFPSSFKKEIKETGAEVISIDKSTKIIDGIYSTGELGMRIKEQSLIINSNKGLIVITGCAHPGIVNIVEKAKELMNKNVYLVMGGFHHPSTSVVKEFKELGVKKVAPSHCTGDPAIEAFAEEYKENYIESGVGKEIKI